MRASKPVCAKCAAAPAPNVRFKSCGKCRFVWYCSPECQRAHWGEHKVVCPSLVANFVRSQSDGIGRIKFDHAFGGVYSVLQGDGFKRHAQAHHMINWLSEDHWARNLPAGTFADWDWEMTRKPNIISPQFYADVIFRNRDRRGNPFKDGILDPPLGLQFTLTFPGG
ncbi:hypothetical protein BDK51DRAFT_30151 [Blyttiomyces helicus]|uniref:MYND-type domain-containing protein n=1 Tax=Blyttiomyces helicus TaxID=388810 RepID=A0A4P9W475_9FUNG|nr:hypothetical protein BDK51DRAFT_30151 [Blyttiomyces helicus]|eukprot:RKO87149.1 hypothetical protein BDK51DRAFT_30151 [Blyttiomyces helicus]